MSASSQAADANAEPGSIIARLRGMDWRVPLALGATYVFFGSGAAATKAALTALPPLSLMAVRGLIAGAILLAWALKSGAKPPSKRQIVASVAIGILILALGTGTSTVGQRTVPSGVAGVLSALLPLFASCLGYVLFREKLPRRALIGLVTGFMGVGLLLRPGSALDPLGVALVAGGQLSWSFAAVLAPRFNLPPDPRAAAGTELLGGGAVLIAASAVLGDLGGLHLGAITLEAWIGLAWLICSAVVGFTAYGYLAKSVPCSIATTFSYVNPAVALLLGWLLFAEPVSPLMLVAVGVIIAGVCLIVSTRGEQPCNVEHPLTSGQGYIYVVRGRHRPMLVVDGAEELAKLQRPE